MKTKRAIYIIGISVFLLIFNHVKAQEVVVEKDLSNGTIKEQFEYINSKSRTQEDYKLVHKNRLSTIQSNILDSLKASRKEVTDLQLNVENQATEISSLNADLAAANETIKNTDKEKNSIGLFGIQMKKSTYKAIMWSIIVILGLLLAFFITRFASSNALTIQSKKRYDEIYDEFEEYKHRSIENDQILRRKLQDEINKRL
jgi:hypothetical protein